MFLSMCVSMYMHMPMHMKQWVPEQGFWGIHKKLIKSKRAATARGVHSFLHSRKRFLTRGISGTRGSNEAHVPQVLYVYIYIYVYIQILIELTYLFMYMHIHTLKSGMFPVWVPGELASLRSTFQTRLSCRHS